MSSVIAVLAAFQLASAPMSDARITPPLPAATSVSPTPAPELSDWYYRRLTIHRYASYTMLPLFVAQYVAGTQLIEGSGDGWAEDAHPMLALGVGALFATNSVTGVWNLWEGRKDPNDRKRRIAHATLMLLADAGFVATGLLGDELEDTGVSGRNTHRAVAIASMATATVGYALMLDIFRRDDP
jgi:hypothetical protein